MASFETIIYYFSITVFIIFNICFWSLLLHIGLNAVYTKILKWINK
jgi:hypothetical protein